jgi:hypothetical protein
VIRAWLPAHPSPVVGDPSLVMGLADVGVAEYT